MARGRVQRHNKQLVSGFEKGFKKLSSFAATIGEASSPTVQEVSKQLVKGLKKAVGARGRSVPGEAPKKRTGQLQRSMGREVVAGQMRVGTGHFTAQWLEFGHVVPPKTVDGKPIEGHVIEPRPFMERGVDLAAIDMREAAVSSLRRGSKGLAA